MPSSSSSIITDQYSSKNHLNSCKFGAAQSKNSTMVKSWICGIVTNWTSKPHPIHSTSLLEEDLSTTRPGTHEFPNCSSRGHEFDSLFSQFYYVILVDLFLVSMLSLKSFKTVHYSLRIECLKFHVEFVFYSIHMI